MDKQWLSGSEHIGATAYVTMDKGVLKLTTESNNKEVSSIYLEQQACQRLLRYAQQHYELENDIT